MNRDEQDAIEVTEYLGWEYEPPITDEERAAFKFQIIIAIIGYACWIGLGFYWFGG